MPVSAQQISKPFWSWRTELTIEGGCVMLGILVVVPHKLRDAELKELHCSHPGIHRMKALARSRPCLVAWDRQRYRAVGQSLYILFTSQTSSSTGTFASLDLACPTMAESSCRFFRPLLWHIILSSSRYPLQVARGH